MSDKTTVSQTGNMLISNFDLTKLFIGNNKFSSATYTNNTGSEVTIVAGTLLGKVTKPSTNAAGELLPFASDDTEGANVPVGIAAQTVTVANTESATINYAVAGEYDLDLLTLTKGTDTLATLVTLSVDDAGDPDLVIAVRELIQAYTQLFGVQVEQLSATDNQ